MNLKRSLEIINRIDRIEPDRFGVRESYWDTRVRVLSEYWDEMWPWRLDLKHWERASSPRFREEIRRDAQLIYDRKGSTSLPIALR